MNDERITLSMREQRTNDVLVKLMNREIKLFDAQKLLGLSRRQIQRKKKAYIQTGIASITHKSKNKPSGRGYSHELKNRIYHLYIIEYPG